MLKQTNKKTRKPLASHLFLFLFSLEVTFVFLSLGYYYGLCECSSCRLCDTVHKEVRGKHYGVDSFLLMRTEGSNCAGNLGAPNSFPDILGSPAGNERRESWVLVSS